MLERHQIHSLRLVGEMSDADILTIVVATSLGEIRLMGEIDVTENRVLKAKGVHIQSDAGPNAIGPPGLRALASFILEMVDCDEARVEGAPRTTGAKPGHRPRQIRFVR